ncbi:hypothetical protein KR018_007332 [Drosophila ironensis]|nr:hypothetical protein KR018_007332 [Drosophila ironensis]
MNPPPARGRAPSRFVRGRARGGGAYRPYFYFRRNGRVIPARGNRQPNSGEAAAEGSRVDPPANRPARGWGRPGNRRGRGAALDCSFLRPENYAAPEDGQQVQSIAVDNPQTHSGWRLYFLRENYQEGSELATRITAVEAHFQRNPHNYDFVAVRDQGFFPLPAGDILQDDDLTKVWPELQEDLKEHPLRTLSTLALAMHTVVVNHLLDTSEVAPVSTLEQFVPPPQRLRKVYVRPLDFVPVEGLSGVTHSRVDTLVAIRGTVTSVGEPTYNLAWQAFRCSRCQMEMAMRQKGTFQPRPYHCKRDECVARDGFLAMRSSPYTRLSVRQIIRLQETLLGSIYDFESSMPEEIDVELRHDLVDSVQLGQKVIITGVLKLQELDEDESAGNHKQAYLRAVSTEDAAGRKTQFSDRDLEAIAAINAEPNSFKLLVQSIAPEVYGHEMAKAACLLSLVGGDSPINVLLVGDPGIGKTKILQSCAQITEHGAHVSGKRGAQSAQRLGITFAGRNKKVLQAGALLTASGGGLCTLDDVDKLASKQSILLQCLQSGEINLPLAGAFGTFPANFSAIACANPQKGQYDEGRYLLQNINIAPALLREFHLVYVLLDKPSERDMSLTAHVRALHAGAKKRAKIAASYAMKPKSSDSICETTFAGGGGGGDGNGDGDGDESVKREDDNDSIMQHDFDLDKQLALQPGDENMDLLPPILIKKFVAYARQEVRPLLNEHASNSILQYFLGLQASSEHSENDSGPIGSGQLHGLIHLSQARARLDLSNEVTPQHVRDVIALLTESIAQTSLKNGGFKSEASGSRSAGGGGGGKSAQLRNFVFMMQQRSAALGRRIFDFEELKEIGNRAGILTGISQLVEIANMGGHLLKKGPNMYEVVPD